MSTALTNSYTTHITLLFNGSVKSMFSISGKSSLSCSKTVGAALALLLFFVDLRFCCDGFWADGLVVTLTVGLSCLVDCWFW